MKLYTKEQVSKIIFETKQWSNLSDDWLMASVTPIELPSDEDIEESETDSPYDRIDEYNYGFIDGANWVKQFIINQNNKK